MKVTEKVNRVNEDEANEEHHDPSLDRTGRSVYSGGGGQREHNTGQQQ